MSWGQKLKCLHLGASMGCVFLFFTREAKSKNTGNGDRQSVISWKKVKPTKISAAAGGNKKPSPRKGRLAMSDSEEEQEESEDADAYSGSDLDDGTSDEDDDDHHEVPWTRMSYAEKTALRKKHLGLVEELRNSGLLYLRHHGMERKSTEALGDCSGRSRAS